MAGAFDGDSRLDLDELGEVIDAPGGYRLGDASADDVLGDDSRVSLGERLEDAGVLPWVRRHRFALGALAAVVVAGAVVGAAYAQSRPPEVAAAPGVQLFGVDVDTFVGDTGGVYVAQQSYSIVRDDATTAAAIDAVRGPGIRTSAVRDVPGATAPTQQTVVAVLECDDRAITATAADFQLHVTSTDTWGRTVEGWMTPPVSALDWAGNVRGRCWEQLTRERVTLRSLGMTPDYAAGAVDLTMEIDNRLPVESLMQVEPFAWDTGAMELSLSVDAQPGDTVRLPARMTVHSCTDPPQLPRVTVPTGRSDAYTDVPGIPFGVSTLDQPYGNSVGLALDADQQRELQSYLDRICAGAPAVTVRGLTYGGATPVGVEAVRVPLRVALDVPDGLTITAATSGDYTPSETTSAPVTAVEGRVSVPWVFQCDFVPQPVDLALVATDRSGRRWPLRQNLDIEILARAVTSSCPGLTPQRLVDEGGWTLEGVPSTYPSGG